MTSLSTTHQRARVGGGRPHHHVSGVAVNPDQSKQKSPDFVGGISGGIGGGIVLTNAKTPAEFSIINGKQATFNLLGSASFQKDNNTGKWAVTVTYGKGVGVSASNYASTTRTWIDGLKNVFKAKQPEPKLRPLQKESRSMKKKPWFIRLGFALIPITWQGLLFEIVMIGLVSYLGNNGVRALDSGDQSRANVFIVCAIAGMFILLVIGLIRSRRMGAGT